MRKKRTIHRSLRPILLVGFLSVTAMLTACPKERQRNKAATDSLTLLNPTPSPVAVSLTPEILRGWQKEIVGSQSPEFKPITFTIPDTPPDTLFSWVELNAYAQTNILGGPIGSLTDDQRVELKRFVDDNKHNSGSMVYINGDDAFEGMDLQAQTATLKAEQDAAVQWVRNALQLHREIDGVSIFQWRPGSALPPVDAPTSLKNYIRSEFQRMKGKLTADQQGRLSAWRVDFGMPPSPSVSGERLWLKTRDNVIWMSPLMLRALLLEATQEELIRDYPTLLKTRMLGSSNSVYDQLGKAEVVNAIVAKFRSSLLFLLAHQMAHVYLTTTPSVSAQDQERLYDAAAVQLAESQLPSLEALRQLLAKAGSSTGFEVAGDKGDVLSRLGG